MIDFSLLLATQGSGIQSGRLLFSAHGCFAFGSRTQAVQEATASDPQTRFVSFNIKLGLQKLDNFYIPTGSGEDKNNSRLSEDESWRKSLRRTSISPKSVYSLPAIYRAPDQSK